MCYTDYVTVYKQKNVKGVIIYENESCMEGPRNLTLQYYTED